MSSRSRAAAFLADAATVETGWAVGLLAEVVVVTVFWPEQFSGVWEIALVRRLVVPIAVVSLAPLAFVAAALWELAGSAARGGRAARVSLACVGACAGAALGFGVSGGRHFASAWARAPFVLAVLVAGAGVGALAAPRVARLARRPPWLAALGVTLAVGFWLADESILPRLYPAFHLAAMFVSLAGVALAAFAVREGSGGVPRVIAGVLPWCAVAVVGACATSWPRATRELERLANVRLSLVERAPFLGAAVVVAMRLHAPPPEEVAAATGTLAGPGEVARALDWEGHDIVLLSVDALRADHVSAYGYARPTTPNIDSLAREGALFEAAYCPTPHTSYSVTSMMTGKYLRPLLALGMGQDSETWAQELRRYGWRTAAFYPPAVFFIDESNFQRFEQEHLGFEYAKVEFAAPELRERQVGEYLDSAPAGVPLFLWVHFFEPHEPYVVHPGHVFGTGGTSSDVDAYDSEIAEADEGVGRIARLVRQRRPGAVIIVTADHGEEFGEHGGRYHGTTVYEEQVRVPLVVAGPGVKPGSRVRTVVQTIDLVPTALSSLGIPRPARVRGRDLGPVIAGHEKAEDTGLAFAETDDYALVASGDERLVCERAAAACALYRPKDDPAEHHDVAEQSRSRFSELRATLRAIERDHGRYEASGGPALPEALKRGMQGEVEAALDVASLLDDAEVTVRRKAAEVCFSLHAAGTAPALRRALSREDDEEARRWIALALARVGEPVPPLGEALLRDASRDWRRRAALALGERGEARACEEIAEWWTAVAPAGGASEDGEPPRLGLGLAQAQELLAATAHAQCRAAVPALLEALLDVRARPYVADALGALGDDRARGPLLARLAVEPYVTTRPHEARALLALGARDWSADPPAADVHAMVRAPAPSCFDHAPAQPGTCRPHRSRAIVLLSDEHASLAPAGGTGEVRELDLPPSQNGSDRVLVDLHASTGGVIALWLVPASD
jgi:hypothetical protein